jgi:hypothetical protein
VETTRAGASGRAGLAVQRRYGGGKDVSVLSGDCRQNRNFRPAEPQALGVRKPSS